MSTRSLLLKLLGLVRTATRMVPRCLRHKKVAIFLVCEAINVLVKYEKYGTLCICEWSLIGN